MKQGLTFLALLALAAAAIWYSLSPQFPVAQGLDLRGGMRVTLEPDTAKLQGQTIDDEMMESVRRVLETRVNSFGLSGTEVRLKGDRQILVLLPGAKNPQEALDTISKVAQLEFRHLNNVQSERNPGARFKMDVITGNASRGEPDRYVFRDTAENSKEVLQAVVLKDSELILKGDSLKPTSVARIDPSNGQPYVSFEFKSDGARIFGNFTSDNVGEFLAVVLDNEVISAPRINEPITEGQGQISGGYKNMAEARVLANLLNSGALPIPLKPAETQSVGATLGQESINKSVTAGLIGLGLVLLFMLCYYWLPGLLACIALIFYSAITFSVFKGMGLFPPIVLDLPGITGFILSVGMAVDANILIFERLKEELRAGKSLHAAIDAGFSRAFSSIFDSNVTTWIVCAILIWLGAPIIKGFAITLAIGVAVSMFTAITVTRTLLHLMIEIPAARSAALYGLNVSWLAIVFPAVRQGGVLRVFEKRRIYLGFSLISGVVALLFIAMTPFGHGLRPGIDFTGGTVIEAPFYEKNVTRENVLQALTTAGISDATVSLARDEQSWTQVTLEATDADQAAEARVKERLEKNIRAFDDVKYTAARDKNNLKVSALFASPVTEAAVRTALRSGVPGDETPVDLKGLKVGVTPQQHAGAEAIPVALIQSQKLLPEELQKLRGELNKVGGGLVRPMYQENSIGPSVASEVTFNAFSSVLVASLAIVLYLAFRFAIGSFINGLKFGGCAVIALVHDVGIVIGLFALMGALRGWQVDSLFVTAALTVLGFSVHDTIVVYDRIRENLLHRRKGETFAAVSDRSITQTFDRSINTSFTVLLVVAALVFFGGESIRLFNIALLVGIGIGTYSSIFVASPLVVMLERMAATRAGTAPAAAGGRPRRDDVSLVQKPRRETAAVPARPAPARPASEAAARETAAGEDAGAADRTRPGTVRPRKKRRM